MKLFTLNAFFFLVLAASALAEQGQPEDVTPPLAAASHLTIEAVAALVIPVALSLMCLVAIGLRAATDPRWESRKERVQPEDLGLLLPLLGMVISSGLQAPHNPALELVFSAVRWGCAIGMFCHIFGAILVSAAAKKGRRLAAEDPIDATQPSPAT